MFGDYFVQAVTDRVTFAVQHFDGQVMILMIILMIMMMVMIIIMVMVMIIMEVMIMKIRFLTGT